MKGHVELVLNIMLTKFRTPFYAGNFKLNLRLMTCVTV
jgi:hypothetical protein